MKVALIQMNSTSDIAENISKVERMVADAASKGAQLIATPENTFLMAASGEKPAVYTQDEHPGLRAASAMAEHHKLWLLIGSVAVLPEDSGFGIQASGGGQQAAEPSAREAAPHASASRRAAGALKTANRSVLFNPQGKIVASYDKIHLFDVEVGDGQTYRESARMLPGDRTVVAQAPWAALGMSVCYDLRFPQLYRALAKAGAQILCVPSAFTVPTGEAHWHVLLRARAIENGCFVIAPAQTGTHAGGRKTYGHSLVVSPWGEVLADGGSEEGVVMAEIDLAEVQKARAKIPSLEHDREFKEG